MTLNQTEFPDGLYTSVKPAWLNASANYPDCAWIAALLGWLLVLFAWRQQAGRAAARGWAWAPWAGAGGIFMALAWLLGVAVRTDNPGIGYLASETAIGAALLLGACGAWLSRIGFATRRARILAAILSAVCAAVTAWQRFDPGRGAWMMIVLATGGAIAWLSARRMPGWARAALGLLAVHPFVSLVGPLAVSSFTLQRYTPATFMAMASGAIQALAAGCTLVGLLRTLLDGMAAEERRALAREARPYMLTGAGILIVGLSLAVSMGVRNRAGQIATTFQRMHQVASHVDLDLLDRCLAPEFKLDGRTALTGRFFTHPVARPRHLATGLARPLERQLRDALDVQAIGVMQANIVTLREGWLIAAIGGARRGLDPRGKPIWVPADYVTLCRRTRPEDLIAWADHADVFEGPMPVGNSHLDHFRVPLVTRDGRMLGWLQFTWISVIHNYAAFNVRSVFCMLTALGVCVTAMIFQQRRMHRQQAAAGRTAKIAAESARQKSAFLASVSHELRTPLQTIRGYAELLQRELPAGPGAAELASLRRESDRLLVIVNDLLDLGALEAGAAALTPAPVSPAACLEQIVDRHLPFVVERGLALHTDIGPTVPEWILFDPDRLRQMLHAMLAHLTRSACSGEIVITLREVERRGPACHVVITLTHTGTIDPVAPVPGIPFVLTHALLQRVGGRLRHVPLPAGGQRCELSLVAEITTAPATPRPTSLRRRRVLVADDNPLVRELFVTHLTELGANCETAADGEEALVRAREGGFDAVVLDFAMPGRDGLAVAQQLRLEGHRALRIVGVSAHASGADRAAAMAVGLDAFLTKPVELSALAAALGESGSPAPPAADGHLALRQTLADLFRADAAAQVSTISDALARRDWSKLGAAAHYLKNSASVVGDNALYDDCAALEDASALQSVSAAQAAWRACLHSLNRLPLGP